MKTFRINRPQILEYYADIITKKNQTLSYFTHQQYFWIFCSVYGVNDRIVNIRTVQNLTKHDTTSFTGTDSDYFVHRLLEKMVTLLFLNTKSTFLFSFDQLLF